MVSNDDDGDWFEPPKGIRWNLSASLQYPDKTRTDGHVGFHTLSWPATWQYGTRGNLVWIFPNPPAVHDNGQPVTLNDCDLLQKIRRIAVLTQSLGYDAVHVAYVSTLAGHHPEDGAPPRRSKDADFSLATLARGSAATVCAWGDLPRTWDHVVRETYGVLRRWAPRQRIRSLGRTRNGAPWEVDHKLGADELVRSLTALEPYDLARWAGGNT